MESVEVQQITLTDAWQALSEISDPEIPVLSLVDLKIIRDVRVEGATATVELTPTFLGCPALDYMKNEIREKLLALGFQTVNVELKLSPAWSTDLLGEEAREKLRVFGIAPPEKRAATLAESLKKPVVCPYCRSSETRLESSFGPTLCKQIYYCEHCRQSFERFKTL
ncbi:MAG: phenylacetate-CoA oxygenase subunit PaaJ [Ignavibacteriae bacterium]|nr:phenylacetate-CoA oxygenase subunit PaaJ [Ignavibacteriota bacterium]